MPFTPLHFGAVLWVYYASKKRLDVPTLAVSSMIIDLEPAIKGWLELPDKHGFFHSYLAVSLLSVPISLFFWTVMTRNVGLWRSWYGTFLVKLPTSELRLRQFLGSALLGGVSHVFLDMFTHQVAFKYTLYPLILSPNPFWQGPTVALGVQLTALGLSVVSLILVLWELVKGKRARMLPQ